MTRGFFIKFINKPNIDFITIIKKYRNIETQQQILKKQ